MLKNIFGKSSNSVNTRNQKGTNSTWTNMREDSNPPPPYKTDEVDKFSSPSSEKQIDFKGLQIEQPAKSPSATFASPDSSITRSASSKKTLTEKKLELANLLTERFKEDLSVGFAAGLKVGLEKKGYTQSIDVDHVVANFMSEIEKSGFLKANLLKKIRNAAVKHYSVETLQFEVDHIGTDLRKAQIQFTQEFIRGVIGQESAISEKGQQHQQTPAENESSKIDRVTALLKKINIPSKIESKDLAKGIEKVAQLELSTIDILDRHYSSADGRRETLEGKGYNKAMIKLNNSFGLKLAAVKAVVRARPFT